MPEVADTAENRRREIFTNALVKKSNTLYVNALRKRIDKAGVCPSVKRPAPESNELNKLHETNDNGEVERKRLGLVGIAC